MGFVCLLLLLLLLLSVLPLLLQLNMCRGMCNYVRLWPLPFSRLRLYSIGAPDWSSSLPPSLFPHLPRDLALALSTTLTHAAAEEVFSISSVSIPPSSSSLCCGRHRIEPGREVEEVAREGTHTHRRFAFYEPVPACARVPDWGSTGGFFSFLLCCCF